MCIGPTWVDSYQTPEIKLAEGVMKLAEGVTSNLWFCKMHLRGEIFKNNTTTFWLRRCDTFAELQKGQLHKCIGPTWAELHRMRKKGLAEGVMRLAEDGASKLWFCQNTYS